jgi:hypothetical protein
VQADLVRRSRCFGFPRFLGSLAQRLVPRRARSGSSTLPPANSAVRRPARAAPCALPMEIASRLALPRLKQERLGRDPRRDPPSLSAVRAQLQEVGSARSSKPKAPRSCLTTHAFLFSRELKVPLGAACERDRLACRVARSQNTASISAISRLASESIALEIHTLGELQHRC